MTRILFIELPIDSWNRFGKHYLPNPGTLAVGTFLKNKGYSVKIVDTYAEGIGWNKLAEVIRKEKPDIIGSSTYTPDIYGRVLLARMVKKINPAITTVFGGTHISLVPEETLRLARDIDFAVIGEGEETFLELVQALERGQDKHSMSFIRGLAYLNSGDFVITPPRPRIDNLDYLPMPDYSMVPMKKYHNSYLPYPAHQGFSCYFSRGCTSNCEFCSEAVLWQHCWRGRSAANIIEEFTVLHRKYDKKAFLLNDDNFLFDRKRNIDFIEGMEKSGLEIEFRAGARVDTLLRDKDLLQGLRKSGLTALQIGVESFDQQVLDGMNKNYAVSKMQELSRCLRNAGIPFSVLFLVIGNLQDDKNSILKILDKAKEYGFGAIQVSSLTPWPGTALFKHMKEEGCIKVWDYRFFDFKHTLMPTKLISMKEIDRLKKMIFFRWYMNINVFARNFHNRHLRHHHKRVITLLFFSSIRYKLIHRFKLWKLFWYNRLIEGIYREHAAFLEQDGLRKSD